MTHEAAAEPDMLALVDAVVREVLGAPIDPRAGFFEAGITSVLLVRMHARLVERLGHPIPLWAPFKYATARALAAHLSDLVAANPRGADQGGADPGGADTGGAGTGGEPGARAAEPRPAVAGTEARRLLRARIRQGKG